MFYSVKAAKALASRKVRGREEVTLELRKKNKISRVYKPRLPPSQPPSQARPRVEATHITSRWLCALCDCRESSLGLFFPILLYFKPPLSPLFSPLLSPFPLYLQPLSLSLCPPRCQACAQSTASLCHALILFPISQRPLRAHPTHTVPEPSLLTPAC